MDTINFVAVGATIFGIATFTIVSNTIMSLVTKK